MKNIKTLIIGAGPTGLGAALHLRELGDNDYLVVERESFAGGLASSHKDDCGFTWDLGGHVQFSHYEIFDEYMDVALGVGGWAPHIRESWVWMRDRFIPYPFQYNLHRLPSEERWACVQGLFEASRGQRHTPQNFHEWILATFGSGVAESFMLPYNFKVWAYPAKMMNHRWIGERVAVPDIDKVIQGICLEKDQVSWGPNNTFRFPRSGGTGAAWCALANLLPAENVRFKSRVVMVDPVGKRLRLEDGSEYGYQRLISTMPLDILASLTGNVALIAPSSKLLRSGVHVVGVGLRGATPAHLATKCWMYFPEDNCPFYRATVFSNYSPANVPDPDAMWSIMVEVSESHFKPVDRATVQGQVIAGLVATRMIGGADDILSVWHTFLPYGYPTPSLDRDHVVDGLLDHLETMSIYSRGRFGAWKYEISNQDHSFMQGWECVGRLHDGAGRDGEPTLYSSDTINTAYHRRAAGAMFRRTI